MLNIRFSNQLSPFAICKFADSIISANPLDVGVILRSNKSLIFAKNLSGFLHQFASQEIAVGKSAVVIDKYQEIDRSSR